MRTNRMTGMCGGLLLLALAGTAEAEQEWRRAPHHQTRGMIERLHHREDRAHGHLPDQRRARNEVRNHHDRDRGHHNHNRRHDDDRHQRDRERHLYWGHERWRDGVSGHRHYGQGRGYWHDYHHGHRRHHHLYRHRFHNNYHYYFNGAGFYFPEYGFIAHGHSHGRHCPRWHFEDFAAGFVLGAIVID